MYDITIRLGEVINNFTIEELKDLKEFLEQFKQIDEFYLKHVKEESKCRK